MKVAKLLKRIVARLRHEFLLKGPLNRFSAALYYFLLDPSFQREQLFVFEGKREHLRGVGNIDSIRYLLRRNVHRLEKALIMRPRRSRFARDYIEETTRAYLTVVEADLMSEERARELKWFTDVLQAYFDAVDMDDFVLPLQRSFMAAATQSAAPEKFFPYPRSGLQKSNVTFEQFKALAIQRRSTRWFEAEPVPRELIDKAVLIGLQAPSACNRQPFEFRIFDHQERCREIANIPMGTSGYAQNIPAIVVVVGKLNAYFDERDRHLIYVDGALASMSFMFALETLGLASCPINWPDMEERERMMEAALGLKKWERPIMLMAVGFPDPEGGIPFSEKAPIDFMRRYN